MTKIKPKFFISNITDILAIFLVLPIQLFILFGVPGFLAYLTSGSEDIALGVVLVFYLIFCSFSVLSINLSESGIHLKRWLGGPKHVEWSQVSGFKEVSASEVIVKGWLWPIFPAREMTPCLSCSGHFLIKYDGGFFYYPPKDKELFTNIMEKYGASQL